MISFFFKILPEGLKTLIRRTFLLSEAIVDPKGYGFFQLMLENANVPDNIGICFVLKKIMRF